MARAQHAVHVPFGADAGTVVLGINAIETVATVTDHSIADSFNHGTKIKVTLGAEFGVADSGLLNNRTDEDGARMKQLADEETGGESTPKGGTGVFGCLVLQYAN